MKKIEDQTLTIDVVVPAKHCPNAELLLHDTNAYNNLLSLRISGYLRYIDAEFIAIKPICRLLGMNYKDVIAYLLSGNKNVPEHKLFRYTDFVYQTTWGVHWAAMVLWLIREFPNIDNHDKVYACLLSLQILRNAGVKQTSQHHRLLISTCLQAAGRSGIQPDIHDYIAENFPKAYDAFMQTRVFSQLYSDVT